MPRYKVKLTEMKNADVRFISLVKRGANRIPFRVIKSLKESQIMGIDLTSINLRAAKAEKAQPQIVGIVVHPTDDEHLAVLKAEVEKAGFKGDKVVKYEDGSAMFSQGELPEDGEGTLVRLSDNSLLILKAADEVAEELVEGVALSKALEAEGFFHGAPVACKAMVDTVEAVIKSDKPAAEIVDSLKQASELFAQYMTALAQVVPAAAVKMDEALGGATKAHVAAKAEKEAADAAAAAEAAKKAEEDAAKVAAEAEAAAAAQKSDDEGNKQEPNKAEDKTAEVLAAIAAMKSELSGSIKAVTDEVTALKESQSKLEEQVQEAAQKAEKATTAVTNTVVASAVKGDEMPHGRKTVKGEDPRSGYFDTAMLPRK